MSRDLTYAETAKELGIARTTFYTRMKTIESLAPEYFEKIVFELSSTRYIKEDFSEELKELIASSNLADRLNEYRIAETVVDTRDNSELIEELRRQNETLSEQLKQEREESSKLTQKLTEQSDRIIEVNSELLKITQNQQVLTREKTMLELELKEYKEAQVIDGTKKKGFWAKLFG